MGQILLSFQSTTYQVVVAYLIDQSCLALVNSRTVARQDPLSLGFSMREYWSGLPFPFAGDLPYPAIEHICGIFYELLWGWLCRDAGWRDLKTLYDCHFALFQQRL